MGAVSFLGLAPPITKIYAGAHGGFYSPLAARVTILPYQISCRIYSVLL